MKLELWRRGGFRDGIKVVKCSGGEQWRLSKEARRGGDVGV